MCLSSEIPALFPAPFNLRGLSVNPPAASRAHAARCSPPSAGLQAQGASEHGSHPTHPLLGSSSNISLPGDQVPNVLQSSQLLSLPPHARRYTSRELVSAAHSPPALCALAVHFLGATCSPTPTPTPPHCRTGLSWLGGALWRVVRAVSPGRSPDLVHLPHGHLRCIRCRPTTYPLPMSLPRGKHGHSSAAETSEANVGKESPCHRWRVVEKASEPQPHSPDRGLPLPTAERGTRGQPRQAPAGAAQQPSSGPPGVSFLEPR